MIKLLLSVAAASIMLSGCGSDDKKSSDNKNNTNGKTSYSAEIRYTSYGVPHIKGDSYGDLGYGIGYAHAQENLCTLSEQLMKLKGEKSLYLGAGAGNKNVISDLGYKALGLPQQAEELFALTTPKAQQIMHGYAAGFNRSLAERNSPADYPSPCRDADWVQQVTPQDLLAYQLDISLLASGRTMAPAIAAANPPIPAVAKAAIELNNQQIVATNTQQDASKAAKEVAPYKLDIELDANQVFTPEGIGSNGWAIGADRSESGNSLLLGNPHFPWDGELRFFENHLTIPGELDVTGVTFIGLPGVLVGFNDNIAWTHTVSQAKHLTMYQLTLDPSNSLRYAYNGEYRDMSSEEIEVQVKQADGSFVTMPKTVYSSHYGPIVDLSSISPSLGWNTKTAISYRDANDKNYTVLDQWLAINASKSSNEVISAFDHFQGNPWANTIMIDKDGDATYVDASNTPKLQSSAELYVRHAILSPQLAPMWQKGAGSILIPGNSSRFEWIEENDGLTKITDAPQMDSKDYVFNSNSSHWLSNLESPLQGYSIMYGPEGTERSARTRYNAQLISDLSGTGYAGVDNKFSLAELQSVMTDNRSLYSTDFRDEIVSHCQTNPIFNLNGEDINLNAACAVLANWDGHYNTESIGAHIMREFLQQYRVNDHTALSPSLFSKGFDVTKPAITPSGLNTTDASEALATAVKRLQDLGVSLNSNLGELQYVIKNDERIAVNGGYSFEGMFNMTETKIPSRSTSDFANLPTGNAIAGTTLSSMTEADAQIDSAAYRVNYGSSFVLSLEMTPEGPQAEAFLSFSQSHDPESENFADQTQLFSDKTWRPVVFDEADIQADLKRTITISQ
jgi:acyl-homoserine-lactone acylase